MSGSEDTVSPQISQDSMVEQVTRKNTILFMLERAEEKENTFYKRIWNNYICYL